MYSIDLSEVINDLTVYECMEIINELTPISNVKVYEVDHNNVVKFVLTNMANKDEIAQNNKHYYESSCVSDAAQVLMNISKRFKYSTRVFLKVYNSKIETCDSVRDVLRNIINEYYHEQNKAIIEKAFMKYIKFKLINWLYPVDTIPIKR